MDGDTVVPEDAETLKAVVDELKGKLEQASAEIAALKKKNAELLAEVVVKDDAKEDVSDDEDDSIERIIDESIERITA